MRRVISLAVLLIIGIFGLVAFQNLGVSEAGDKDKKAAKDSRPLSHDVFFALKDNSPEARKKMVEACRKYLSGHPGELFFATGERADAFKRDVNDLDFDVALHIVFRNDAAHDLYQDAPRHEAFIKENKDNWKKVRVFDSHSDVPR